MASPSPPPEEVCLRRLGYDLQTALAGISGHAQLLHRQLQREPLREPERHLARLERMAELVRHTSGLVALLQRGEWRDYGAERDRAAGRDDQSPATRRSA